MDSAEKTFSAFGVFLGVALVVSFGGCRVIEDGQCGVRKVLGHISDDPVNTGVTLNIPVVYGLEKWNTKTREMKETASVPSSEGLISTLDVSLIYRVTSVNSPLIRKTWGEDFEKSILEPYFRETIRLTVSGYPVKSLYSEEGRQKIGQQMMEHLISKVGTKVEIIDVLLRDIKLPETFSQSIEKKLKVEQEAMQQEFELQKSVKKAQIAVAEAKGVAEANLIIADSITDNYIKWSWINNMKMSEFQVIYVPTEAGIPILEAGRRPTEASVKAAKKEHDAAVEAAKK